jgi:EH domain-containing protein 1
MLFAIQTLAVIWELANDRRLGYLDRLAFHKAMDLIALAQTVRPASALQPPLQS